MPCCYLKPWLHCGAFQEAAQALLSAQQVGCVWPNVTCKIDEYLGRAEELKQLATSV